MPHVDLALSYTLRLSGQEVNLIGKKLAGLPLTDDQEEECRLLNLRLMELKAKTLQKALTDAQHTLEKAAQVVSKEDPDE